MKKPKIRTIDIHAREWFDRVNGNSYFAALVTINYQLPGERSYKLPFQYGYGDHYRDQAMKALQEAGEIPKDYKGRLWQYRDEFKIILRADKVEGCRQRELKQLVA